MKGETVTIALAALLGGVIIGYGASHASWDKDRSRGDAHDAIPMGMHRMPDGSLMHNGGTQKTDTGMMGGGMGMGMMHGSMAVASERAFIEGMIPHHEEAVTTARAVLARGGTTPEIKTLAQNIITAQEKEIADMKAWYEAWYGTPYVSKGTYVPMMRDLSTLSGKELDRTFLSDMVMHHMGAIMMAYSVEAHIEHNEMKTLTQTIIASQSKEIEDMRAMLTTLK